MTFIAGEIIGHRYWIVSWGLNLFGPHSWRHWNPHAPMSGNVKRDSHAGVYALKTRKLVEQFVVNTEALKELAKTWRSPPLLPPPGQEGPTGLAIGTVMLWGSVWEHETGFRGQFGRVHTIDVLIEGDEFAHRRTEGAQLRLLRTKYGCVCPSADMKSTVAR
jgi:hypothetical protein